MDFHQHKTKYVSRRMCLYLYITRCKSTHTLADEKIEITNNDEAKNSTHEISGTEQKKISKLIIFCLFIQILPKVKLN